MDEPKTAPALEGGNYEVIRARLLEQAGELGRRAEALNAKRKETFGGTELAVIATERVRTEHNCIPVDIVEIGGRLLLGYNVFIGLKSETKVSDVFSLHRFEEKSGPGSSADGSGKQSGSGQGGYDCAAVGFDEVNGFLQSEPFVKDFTALYKYTREAQLLQLVTTDTRLYAVFQIGSSWRETKVFRWAIEANGTVRYLDDRGEREYKTPRQHDFEWREPRVEDQIDGRYLRIADKVFVSCIEGRLRLSVEDNTRTGKTVLTEPVEDQNQVLSDAAVRFAEVGHLVVLEILPFREQKKRYFVFNHKSKSAVRIDAIGQACVELPEDHGLVFPGGFYLETGDHKVFDGDTTSLEFHKKLGSPNGEDVLFLFYEQSSGKYLLFPYNLIRKEVSTPISCGGYSLFDDGRLLVFRDESEPTRVHPMQLWQTPFVSAEFAAAAPTDGSFLSKVGNADLVRGISDALSLCRLCKSDTPSRQGFEDLIAAAGRLLDGFYWLGSADALDMKAVVALLRATAELIIDEFEKVVAFAREAEKALADAEERFVVLGRDLRPEHWRRVDPFLEALAKLRMQRGQVITLRELRYMNLARLGELEKRVAERFDEVSKSCVQFLLREEALKPLIADLDAVALKMADVKKAAEVKPYKEKLDVSAEGLALLGEVVGNLKIDDATQRTRILEGLSVVFGQLNRTRAVVEGRRKELAGAEGRAEVVVQIAVLGQAVSSALGLCDTPEKCDEQLSRLLVQLEELEGRFSELDEFAAQLAQKRDEIYEAFGGKKQQLLDEKAKRVQNLAQAAERILEGIGRRGRAQKSIDELNAYFASDAMVLKVQDLCQGLGALGDSVKADSFLAKLKNARQDALRGLRDKLDLFEGEGELIKLGRHKFSVNTQPLELTMVPREGGLAFHLTGTDYHELVTDAEFAATRAFWDQTLPSETKAIYRGEFLAYSLLMMAERGAAVSSGPDGGPRSIAALREAQRNGKLGDVTRAYAADRHEEGYERGVHDVDAALILDKLLTLYDSAGLLRFAPAARGLGQLFWEWHEDSDAKRRWSLQAQSLGRLRKALGRGEALALLGVELGDAIAAFCQKDGLGELAAAAADAGGYLVEELTGEAWFTSSADAEGIRDALLRQLDVQGTRRAFDDDLRLLEGKLRERHALCRAWVLAFLEADPARADKRHLLPEVVALAASRGLSRVPSAALVEAEVTGLLGSHPRIEKRRMLLRIDETLMRLGGYVRVELPAYRAYRKLRSNLLERERAVLRLGEYIPRVMSAFVRNKLINDVYLPLVGANLAKQIGAAGEGKRTDLMGLLLLVSPPGYGKTTLMEYVASRLGLVFVKVNGPALGHGVVSIDPAEAPNATSRQEVEKINLGFEMGNNVMLYLDDIQHTSPELLQKFISLCDAQRKIEGVWRGKTRTYDFRGRKFCVVMAGNPYTESGEAFKIPDMLANRADTYNLGDILGGKEETFAASYLENALTSSPVLAPLATRDPADIDKLIAMARGEPIASTDLKHGYSAVELEEVRAVFARLLRIQQTLLRVNKEYIASAAQDDRFRSEPPFKLQGSYRNMNKLAEKVVPAMTDGEIDQLVSDHYQSEAQTLTTGAESNLLKLRELRGLLAGAEAERWQEIRREFTRHKRMGGSADDPVARLAGSISGIGADLQAIRDVLGRENAKGVESELAGIRAALDRDPGKGVAAALAGIRTALAEGALKAAEKTADKGAHKGASSAADEAMNERIDRAIGWLEAIRDALDAVAKRVEPLPKETRGSVPLRQSDVPRDDGDHPRLNRARTLAGSEAWLTPYLLRIEAALEAIGRPQIDVHAALPPAIETLLAEQIRVVEKALLPLAQAAAGRSEESELALSAVRSLLENQRASRKRGV